MQNRADYDQSVSKEHISAEQDSMKHYSLMQRSMRTMGHHIKDIDSQRQ